MTTTIWITKRKTILYKLQITNTQLPMLILLCRLHSIAIWLFKMVKCTTIWVMVCVYLCCLQMTTRTIKWPMVMILLTVVAFNFMCTGKHSTAKNPMYSHLNLTTRMHSTNPAAGNNPAYSHPISTTGTHSTNSAAFPMRNNPAYSDPHTCSKWK